MKRCHSIWSINGSIKCTGLTGCTNGWAISPFLHSLHKSCNLTFTQKQFCSFFFLTEQRSMCHLFVSNLFYPGAGRPLHSDDLL